MVIRNAVTSLRNSVVASSAGQGSGEVELGHDSNGDDKALVQQKLGQRPDGCYYHDTRLEELFPRCIRRSATEPYDATL